ncbi:MAG: hypothetical protein IPM39_12860 [Chloroflexi bacterium]|nr:hypothetical protein [Chloroflexota bacterium]
MRVWVFVLRDKLFLLAVLPLFLLAACQSPPAQNVLVVAQDTATAVLPTATPVNTPTLVPPTATLPPPATETAVPAPDLAITADNLHFYPAPYVVDGDQVTIQIIPQMPAAVNWENVTVHVLVNDQELTSGPLMWRNLATSPEALFEWAWDTTGLAGDHQVQVILDRDDLVQIGDENPDNNQVTAVITVQPHTARTAAEVNATWVTAENNCCRVHVVTNTAAYRDLTDLLVLLDQATAQAAARLSEPLRQKIEIYFIDRVIGQGGYAGSAMVISYLDRQYNGQGLYETLVHESTHVIDRQFAPRRISFLAEGVAVWATGGHYKPEDLNTRSAALLTMGEYVPLANLADDFYPVQHEVGYLQAGGFVEYLVNTYGWSRFREFYSVVTLDNTASASAALDANLQVYYEKSLAEMEAEWQSYLRALVVDETAVTDLATTIRYYDVMRRYQIDYDPAAYFLTAWLPYPNDVQTQGNTADLTRRPRAEVNITLEAMLASADEALRAGDYGRANILLDSVTRVLDNDGAFLDPLATNYRNIVRQTAEEGYEVQHITLNGQRAELIVTKTNTTYLNKFNMVLRGQEWILTN